VTFVKHRPKILLTVEAIHVLVAGILCQYSSTTSPAGYLAASTYPHHGRYAPDVA